jgi:hypothetical protein
MQQVQWSVTHGTSGHTGGKGGGNAHTQVNLGVPLLPDPLVWNVALPLPLHSGNKTFLHIPLNVGKEMPISRIVVAVPNATVVLLD